MKSIEDKIRMNRELFDQAEPSGGHFARFAQKLDKQEATANRPVFLRFAFIWRAAAAVLILFAVAMLYKQIDEFSLIKNTQSQDLPAELLEASNYYAVLNQNKISEITKLTSDNPDKAEIAAIALQEAQAIDQSSQELKEKYLDTKDERVIDAIITNYRVLGDLLDHIITRVNETR